MSRPGILLVNPTISSRKRARFPLSLLNLAAALGERYEPTIIDGNIDRDTRKKIREAFAVQQYLAAGITVMGGPQVETAIDVSKVIRDIQPDLPIVWGGYFPTLYPEVALNADYVDFIVRGQGEDTFCALLDALASNHSSRLGSINGLAWRDGGSIVATPPRAHSPRHVSPKLDYKLLNDPKSYLVETFLGKHTAAYQGALGCRFRCTFCGVAAMFEGSTFLPGADRLDEDLRFLKNSLGADSIQFYDHNFFDREDDMLPLLEVLAQHKMPWWCYARADALVNLSAHGWRLVKESRLRMAYIGAETPNDSTLRSIRKGTRSEQTLEVTDLCARHDIIPELSFMVAPPEDPEGETEKTFEFIRLVKRVNPQAEIIVYVNTPLPPASVPRAEQLVLPALNDVSGDEIVFPSTPEEWTEKRWVDYACHLDAPWLTDRLRRRIHDFVTVLRCRYPTIQDTRSPNWAKAALRGLAGWRYASGRYDRPWELRASHKLMGLLDPRISSI